MAGFLWGIDGGVDVDFSVAVLWVLLPGKGVFVPLIVLGDFFEEVFFAPGNVFEVLIEGVGWGDFLFWGVEEGYGLSLNGFYFGVGGLGWGSTWVGRLRLGRGFPFPSGKKGVVCS